jgi:hypothetical protein
MTTRTSVSFSLLIPLVAGTVVAADVGLSPEEYVRVDGVYKHAFERTSPNGLNHARLQGLPDADRELLIRWLRWEIGEKRSRGEREQEVRRSGSATDLAILGDEWGIECVVESYRSSPRHRGAHLQFSAIRNAKVIAMIGDLLFMNEEYVMADDVGVTPTQWSATDGVIATVRYAPQFQPDINQWGQELWDAWNKGGGDVINILREWYRENEEKLRAGAFQDVRPGLTPLPRPDAASLPLNTQEALPSARDGKPVATVAVPQASPANSEWTFAAIAAGCLVLLGGLLVFWKRRPS